MLTLQKEEIWITYFKLEWKVVYISFIKILSDSALSLISLINFFQTKLPNFTVQLTKRKHHHPAWNKNTPKRRIQLQNYNSKVHQPNNHELKPSTNTPSTATQKCTHSKKSLMSSYGPLCNADGSLFPMSSGRPLPTLPGGWSMTSWGCLNTTSTGRPHIVL